MSAAWIGLGGNLGEPQRQMGEALRALDARGDISVVAVSSVYRTPPWGLTEQPDFLNCCAGLETSLPPAALLRVCLDVERQLHRERGVRWGPRTIDIDLLDYDGLAIETDGLVLPHPRMTERAFVLVPLAEIASELAISGRSVAAWRDLVERADILQLETDPAWWRGEPPIRG